MHETAPHARFASAAAVLLASAVLLALAAPRVYPTWARFMADQATAPLYRGEPLSTDMAERGLSWLTASLSTAASAEGAREYLDLALAASHTSSPGALPDRGRLQQAEAYIEAAVRKAPADAYLLLRLARVRLLLGRDPASVASAALASMERAPNARNLVIPRLWIALSVWQVLRLQDLEIIQQQVRFAYIDLNLRNDIIDIAKATSTAGYVSLALQGRHLTDGVNAFEDFFRLLRR